MKVLLVEDTVGEPIAKVVGRWGHEVLLATSATEARLLLMDHRVDLMLVDWMLPGASGIELVQQIHKEEARQSAPVIMISGRMQQEDITQALAAGIDAYLAKPFTAAQLRTRIDEVMGQWRQRQQLVPAVDRIMQVQQRFRERASSPLVLVADRACTREGLLRCDTGVVGCLAGLADAVDAMNDSQPGLELGYALVDRSADLVKLLQIRSVRPRTRLVVISVEAGGTPVAAARMLSGGASADMRLMVVCGSPEDLGLKTWYALEEGGVLLERRGTLDTQRWLQLLQAHVLEDDEVS